MDEAQGGFEIVAGPVQRPVMARGREEDARLEVLDADLNGAIIPREVGRRQEVSDAMESQDQGALGGIDVHALAGVPQAALKPPVAHTQGHVLLRRNTKPRVDKVLMSLPRRGSLG